MDINKKTITICCKLLEIYQVAQAPSLDEIKGFKKYKAQRYGFTNVYSFDYKNKHYYVSDDYSLADSPKYLRDILEDISLMVKGGPLKNPMPQSDGAIFASGLDGVEYYLWVEPKV